MTDSPKKKLVTISEHAVDARSGSDTDYLSGLNPEQRDAVETTEGPLLVLAGAGTGKTRVLTTRIAHILSRKLAWPSQILAVTFTNKASREMRNRVQLITRIDERFPWLGTFHSVGMKILRYHCERVGLRHGFSIIDTDDQIRLLKQLLESENIDSEYWTAKNLAAMIDNWKNRFLGPSQIEKHDESFADSTASKLYELYQERLKVLNACDFGDLLMEPLHLLRENPDILSEYRDRFRYILVDEYQDTNIVQYFLLKLLSGGKDSPNICCVGDDDQSIYGWRGAEVDNILRFESDFLGAKIIRLERNYRSTRPILEVASHLVSHNEGRLGKTLHSAKDDPNASLVKVTEAKDSDDEVIGVCDIIESFHYEGHSLDEIAILVRTSSQMRAFEDQFILRSINYRVIGGARFYERMEIRDALAYFRIVCQPSNDLAFERIINKPRRGLGTVTLQTIRDYAHANSVPMLSAARSLINTNELKPKQREALQILSDNIERWSECLETMDHISLARTILDKSNYMKFWKNDLSPDAPTRLDNLQELIHSLERFGSLPEFLDYVSLVMDDESSSTEDSINLMTLHSAKGFEADSVFLPGWEEGLFPHRRSIDDDGLRGLEEERRLAYVGLTRARRYCHIWHTSYRQIHGEFQYSIPSRFIDELPSDHIETDKYSSNYGSYNRIDANKSTGSFNIDDRVFHIKYGYGLVVDVDGENLTINFEHSGEKHVVAKYVQSA